MIRINKDNIEFNRENFESIKKGWEVVEEDKLMYYLYDKVIIGDDVRFERIFDLIISHKSTLNVVLGWGSMHGHTIDMFIDEYNQPSDTDTDIAYLEIQWATDYGEWVGEKEVTLYTSLHGIGKAPEEIPYSIGFSPINKLKNLPFKINDNVEWRKFIDSGITLTAEGRYPILLQGRMDMKLIDMFNGILYEMTFYGGPKNRQKVADGLQATSERIDRGEEDLYEIEGWDDKDGPKFRKLTEEEKQNLRKKDNDAPSTTERK